ncbi:MAG: hypothetical protein WBE18_05205, partial [Gammaproteobacteria bacterium]
RGTGQPTRLTSKPGHRSYKSSPTLAKSTLANTPTLASTPEEEKKKKKKDQPVGTEKPLKFNINLFSKKRPRDSSTSQIPSEQPPKSPEPSSIPKNPAIPSIVITSPTADVEPKPGEPSTATASVTSIIPQVSEPEPITPSIFTTGTVPPPRMPKIFIGAGRGSALPPPPVYSPPSVPPITVTTAIPSTSDDVLKDPAESSTAVIGDVIAQARAEEVVPTETNIFAGISFFQPASPSSVPGSTDAPSTSDDVTVPQDQPKSSEETSPEDPDKSSTLEMT